MIIGFVQTENTMLEIKLSRTDGRHAPTTDRLLSAAELAQAFCSMC